MTDDGGADRRTTLNAVALAALVADHLGVPDRHAATGLPIGAALVVDGHGWVLLDDGTARTPRLGAAVAWAVRAGVDRLDVLARRDTSTLARRAQRLTLPIDVWHVDARTLLPAAAVPLGAPPSPPDRHLALADLIVAGGADVVVEHGVVTGEVRGLEVCRVADRGADAVVLEVGIGANDREAFAMMHGDVPTAASLARVVAQVEAQRQRGAPPHPLNRLAAERFVRWRLTRSPELVGAGAVEPRQPPLARHNVADAVACRAIADAGTADERDVVCSAGADLELVPFALDVQRDEVPLVIALPERDLLPITSDLVALMRVPPALVTIS